MFYSFTHEGVGSTAFGLEDEDDESAIEKATKQLVPPGYSGRWILKSEAYAVLSRVILDCRIYYEKTYSRYP